MSKVADRKVDDDLRAEYDFASMGGGIRGKYYQRYRKGVNLALLEPDIAKAFPTDQAVNAALRGVMRASKPSKRRTKPPNNRMQLTRSRKSRRLRTRS
jgi:hypothetical protein